MNRFITFLLTFLLSVQVAVSQVEEMSYNAYKAFMYNTATGEYDFANKVVTGNYHYEHDTMSSSIMITGMSHDKVYLAILLEGAVKKGRHRNYMGRGHYSAQYKCVYKGHNAYVSVFVDKIEVLIPDKGVAFIFFEAVTEGKL